MTRQTKIRQTKTSQHQSGMPRFPYEADWQPIEGYPEYWISDLGDVYSEKTDRILKPNPAGRGYLAVTLMDEQHKPHNVKLHRIVAETFCVKPDSDEPLEVNHIDEDKTNNKASNLEWVSHLYNVRYGTGIERGGKQVILTNNYDTTDIHYFSTMTEAAKWLGCGIGQVSAAYKRNGSCHGYKVTRIS